MPSLDVSPGIRFKNHITCYKATFMLSPKIILLFTLSVLNISVHSQNTPPPPAPPDTTKMKDTGFVVWKKYLEQNINPNTPANYGAPAGIYNVYVQFIIARD